MGPPTTSARALRTRPTVTPTEMPPTLVRMFSDAPPELLYGAKEAVVKEQVARSPMPVVLEHDLSCAIQDGDVHILRQDAMKPFLRPIQVPAGQKAELGVCL